MSEPFLAEIRLFCFQFAPKGWAFCNGQMLPVQQNTALFALLGTTYGGQLPSVFALPDMQGRAPMHSGHGPGRSPRTLGETGGSAAVALQEIEMPGHTHALQAAGLTNADVSVVGNGSAFTGSIGGALYQDSGDATLAPEALTPAGASLPHNNMMPYLAVNFCIALQGVFPQRP